MIDILHPREEAWLMIALIDYQAGNLGSILNMFKKVGVSVEVSTDPQVIEAADKIILPGIGRFDYCMQALEKSGLIPLLERKILQEKAPCLGICVGYQLMAEFSEEGDYKGLGWIPAQVRKFRFDTSLNLKVPHMGWNYVRLLKDSAMIASFGEEPRFYFAHSYYVDCKDSSIRLLETDYGISFTAAIQRENLIGVQFHPEKSHKFGMALFKNFAEFGK